MTKYNTTDCRCGYCEHCAPGDYETIPDDHPIWAERDNLMFPSGAAMEWPSTGDFFADQITKSASAMQAYREELGADVGVTVHKPVPTLCLAVCPTHHWSCAAELPHGNGAHVCNHGGQPHHFFTRKQ